MSTLKRVSLLLAVIFLLAACGSSAPAESSALQEEAPATDTPASEELGSADTPQPEEAAQEAGATRVETSDEAAGEQSADPPRRETFTILSEESEASYSIDEVFINDNNTLATAVGVTSMITGSLTLNYDNPAASEFTPFVVDISTLASDRSRRDRAIRREWLESSTYPLATFDVTEIRNFPANPEEGTPLSFQLAGDMTVKETTREVVWDVTVTLEGDRLTGTATFVTFLADFNIPVPSIAGVLRVTDGLTLTLDFVMQRDEE
jgi:polyisoprenoid-binding protein YceI